MATMKRIDSYSGSSSIVSLPTTQDDVRVAVIGSTAFTSNSTLTQITGDSILKINDGDYWEDTGAFVACYSLTTVNFPSCTYIGKDAFNDCNYISSINFPKCSYVGESAFLGCPLITTLDLPECSYIGNEAFCYSPFTSISLPKCSYIGESAFDTTSPFIKNQLSASGYAELNTDIGNKFLLDISASSSFTNFSGDHTFICNEALAYCSTITSVSFPKCSYIYGGAFYKTGISSFQQSWFNSSYFQVIDGILFSSNGAYLNAYPFNGSSVAEESCCIKIGYKAFWSCSTITSVSFSSCSYIDNEAFNHCTALTTANFPACSYIGSSAFDFCTSLSSVNFSNCSYIGEFAFSYCASLTSISLPKCRGIERGAFMACGSLTSLSLPECSYINGDYTFAMTYSLSTLYLMSTSVCSLETSDAFYWNAGITSSTGSIIVPSSLVDQYKVASEWSYFATQIFGV